MASAAVAPVAPAPAQDGPAAPAGAKEHLNTMLRAADSGSWDAVDAAVKAVAALPRTGTADAQKSRPLNEQGIRAISNGQYAEAIPLLASAVDLDPLNAEIRNNLGYAQLRAGQLAEAEKNIKASLELNASRASAWANLSEVLAEKDLPAAAGNCLKVALYLSNNRGRMTEALKKAGDTFTSVKFRQVIAGVLPAVDTIPPRP